MKKILVLLLIFTSIFSFCGCGIHSDKVASDYLRIHIRANSNSMEDQNVKYKVKDEVVEFLTPIIAKCKSKYEMKSEIEANFENIEQVANNVLMDNGLNYFSKVELNKEYFPTRTYGDLTLEADYYDAIIVNLGTGSGNNWWCVVYPPLCFYNSKETNTTGFKYKSYIYELINKFFK